jgi:hypothetical protein
MNQLQTNIMTFHAGTEIPSKRFVPGMELKALMRKGQGPKKIVW